MIQIYQWQDISQNQWNSLLLGNGASIAMHPGFSYGSLHSVSTNAGSLPTTAPIFSSLGTTDFEYVLLACWHASLVNNALGAPSPFISNAYSEVRDALITAVQQTHCLPTTVTQDIQRIGVFASRFGTVLTLNYDLTLYWAMIEFNRQNGNWFKDGFINGYFSPQWQQMRTPYLASGATMVFFIHGSLMLARDISGGEVKFSSSPSTIGSQTALLNTITNAWRTGTHTPIFVSEGTTSQKFQSIRRSPYLTTVYNDVLSKVGGDVVVYGLSFAQNDQHILNGLKQNPPRLMAISVYGGLSPADQQSFCHNVSSQLTHHLPTTRVIFYDSRSSGCWNN